MRKKAIFTGFLALFLLGFMSGFAGDMEKGQSRDTPIPQKEKPVKHLLFHKTGFEEKHAESGYNHLGKPSARTVAPARQLPGNAVTKRDRQHYTCPGRQIVYAGHYNSNCDYVYMNYSSWTQQGATVFHDIYYAVFDWDLTHNWVLDTEPASQPGSGINSCNLDATPDSGLSVISYNYRSDENSPYYSNVGYAAVYGTSAHSAASLSGPPNLENTHTGYCGDYNAETSPYLWPQLDLDTNNTGDVITHVAATEVCHDNPAGTIEISSLIYYRKIATLPGQPWSGAWQGPYFMDSSYVISPIVRADKRPTHQEVYYAYLQPIYYYNGDNAHPCEDHSLGHYQITNEVVYKVSNDDGASWSVPNYVTNYASGYEDGLTEPATYDLTAMVDEYGTFHIVWSSANRDPYNICRLLYASKMWHWDNSNNCISLVYDASHPAYFAGDVGAWNMPVAKHNISYCDNNLYISFTRFGAHPLGDTSFDYGAGDDVNHYQNADIMVVVTHEGDDWGKIWSDGVNLTDTEDENCAPGDCPSEHWPTMAMNSSDSLMLLYIEDKDPGAYGYNDEGASVTDNPVMFMTWNCFNMNDVDLIYRYETIPDPPVWQEVALAPYGETAGCTTPASYKDSAVIGNYGNVDLNYTTSITGSWLSIESGGSGVIEPGIGPLGSYYDGWTDNGAAAACASPVSIVWEAGSEGLGEGNYSGSIDVNFAETGVEDFTIEIDLVVTCNYYLPEYATITGGCWTVDLWNTPKAGNGSERDYDGNMEFYACGGDENIHPLYTGAYIIGWIDRDTKCYSDYTAESYGYRMRALGSTIINSFGISGDGDGYYYSQGFWCTPDSQVHGLIEYFVPEHQQYPFLIEKITIWNESEDALPGFVVGKGIDWDVRSDEVADTGGIDVDRHIVYQRGTGNPDFDSVVAGFYPYYGYDQRLGAAILKNSDYIYPDTGYNVDQIYDYLCNLDGDLIGYDGEPTDLNCVYRLGEEYYFSDYDTITFTNISAISLDGIEELMDMMDLAASYVESNSPKMKPFAYTLQNYGDLTPRLGLPNGEKFEFVFSNPNSCCNVELHELKSDGVYRRAYWNESHNKRKIIEVDESSSGYFKIKHCGSPSDEQIDIAARELLTADRQTSPSNPEVYAGFAMGGEDSSSAEFGNNLTSTYANYGADSIGFNFKDAPAKLGISCTGAVKNYTISFTTYDNDYWNDMEIYFDVLNFVPPCSLIVSCDSADISSFVININGTGGISGNLGNINHPLDSVELEIIAVGCMELDWWAIRTAVSGGCTGLCGDANNDGNVNVSDAVKIINYVFIGGGEPEPALACGDANNDGTVNVSDAVSIINYVFIGGNPPGDCMPGSANWYNGDCCPFE